MGLRLCCDVVDCNSSAPVDSFGEIPLDWSSVTRAEPIKQSKETMSMSVQLDPTLPPQKVTVGLDTLQALGAPYGSPTRRARQYMICSKHPFPELTCAKADDLLAGIAPSMMLVQAHPDQ